MIMQVSMYTGGGVENKNLKNNINGTSPTTFSKISQSWCLSVYLFVSIWFFFHKHSRLPSTSLSLRHQPDDYCRELIFAHSQQPDSNREPLLSEYKLLTTKLGPLKPDIAVIKKLYKEATILDIAILWDVRVASKENERIEKYRPLKDEIARMQGVGKVVIIPVAAVILEAVPNRFQKFAEGTEIDKGVDEFHKTVLMRTATISRLVLEGQVTRRKKYGYFLTPDNCLF